MLGGCPEGAYPETTNNRTICCKSFPSSKDLFSCFERLFEDLKCVKPVTSYQSLAGYKNFNNFVWSTFRGIILDHIRTFLSIIMT